MMPSSGLTLPIQLPFVDQAVIPFPDTLKRRPPPVISIQTGGGYAGSVYSTSRIGGQWYADGAPIAGATAQTWTMTQALEGAAITYRIGPLTSNVIEMWVLTDLDASMKASGGWWDIKRGGFSVVGSKLSVVPDGFGVRNMSQSVDANRPTYTVNDAGYPAMTWPSSGNNNYLAPASSFAPNYWAIVLRYRDGATSLFPVQDGQGMGGYPNIISNGVSPNRVMGEVNTNRLYATTVWTNMARKNAGTAISDVILPLPKTLLEFGATGVSAAWALGRGASGTIDGDLQRGWQGPMFEVLALGAAPAYGSDARNRLQGCMAWRNGLQGSLPSDHPYKSAAPRVS